MVIKGVFAIFRENKSPTCYNLIIIGYSCDKYCDDYSTLTMMYTKHNFNYNSGVKKKTIWMKY